MSKTSTLENNEWILRTTVKEGTCFVCYKSTFQCLLYSNLQTPLDWFYTCLSHLNDPGFATLISEPENAIKPRSTEVNNVTSKTPSEPSQETKDQANLGKGLNDDNNKDTQNDEKQEVISIEKPKVTNPVFKKYRLHKDILYLREAQIRSRESSRIANAAMSKFPSIPKNKLP